MISVYAETSAALHGLIGVDPLAASALADAEHRVFTSSLTLVEIERNLGRAALQSPEREADVRRRFNDFLGKAVVLDMNVPVLSRAKQRFLIEPVRTLDALHLATILCLIDDLKWCAVLSNDKRIRENVVAYGLTLLPSAGPSS